MRVTIFPIPNLRSVLWDAIIVLDLVQGRVWLGRTTPKVYVMMFFFSKFAHQAFVSGRLPMAQGRDPSMRHAHRGLSRHMRGAWPDVEIHFRKGACVLDLGFEIFMIWAVRSGTHRKVYACSRPTVRVMQFVKGLG